MLFKQKPPYVLVIGGFDPISGAGVGADMRALGAVGCYPLAAITVQTVQNTQGVHEILPTPADFFSRQLNALLGDVNIDAVKIGMIPSQDILEIIAEFLFKLNKFKKIGKHIKIVLDPVLAPSYNPSKICTSVSPGSLLHTLAPLVDLITPNSSEIGKILEITTTIEQRRDVFAAVLKLSEIYPGRYSILCKGGHLVPGPLLWDLLYSDLCQHWICHSRIKTVNTHGTGCVLASLIAGYYALGDDCLSACFQGITKLGNFLTAGQNFQFGIQRGQTGPALFV